MSPAELAAHGVDDRRRVLAAAIADERRGLAIRRAGAACSTAAIERNLERLAAQLAALDTERIPA